MYEIHLAAQTYDNTPYAMSCSAVSKSEDSWAARRAGTNSQVRANDFTVGSVPEPSIDWMLAGGISGLGLLSRRRSAHPRRVNTHAASENRALGDCPRARRVSGRIRDECVTRG